MQNIQMTLDEELLADVDHAVEELNTSRSAFIRDALRTALASLREKAMEARHRAGYQKQPVEPGEFDGWDDEQTWLD